MRAFLRWRFHWPLHCLCALTLAACSPEPLRWGAVLPGDRLAGDSPRDRVKVSAGEVGTVESPTGSNRGVRVDEYNRTCGLVGEPWCASFARWTFWQVGTTNGVPGAWSPEWGRLAAVPGAAVRRGDVGLVWFPSLGRYAHVCAAVEEVRTRGTSAIEVVTVEGNTNPDGGREGYGVFRRVRRVDSLAFVRLPDAEKTANPERNR